MAVSNLYRTTSFCTNFFLSLSYSLSLKLNKFAMLFFILLLYVPSVLMWTITSVTIPLGSSTVFSTIAQQNLKINLLSLKNAFENVGFSSGSLPHTCGYRLSKPQYSFFNKISLSFLDVLGGECITWATWFLHLNQYCAGDKIEKNKMGRACGEYGWGERGLYGLDGETGGKETTGET